MGSWRSGLADWETGERWRAEQGRRTASPPPKPESFLPSWSGRSRPSLNTCVPGSGPCGPLAQPLRGSGARKTLSEGQENLIVFVEL